MSILLSFCCCPVTLPFGSCLSYRSFIRVSVCNSALVGGYLRLYSPYGRVTDATDRSTHDSMFHAQMSSYLATLADWQRPAIARFSRRSDVSYFSILKQCLMVWSVDYAPRPRNSRGLVAAGFRPALLTRLAMLRRCSSVATAGQAFPTQGSRFLKM